MSSSGFRSLLHLSNWIAYFFLKTFCFMDVQTCTITLISTSDIRLIFPLLWNFFPFPLSLTQFKSISQDRFQVQLAGDFPLIVVSVNFYRACTHNVEFECILSYNVVSWFHMGLHCLFILVASRKEECWAQAETIQLFGVIKSMCTEARVPRFKRPLLMILGILLFYVLVSSSLQ